MSDWNPTQAAQDSFVALDKLPGLDKGPETVHTVVCGQYFRAASLNHKNRNKKGAGVIYLSISNDFKYGGIGRVVLARRIRRRAAKVKQFSKFSTDQEIELEKKIQVEINSREKNFDVITPGGKGAHSEKILLREVVQVFKNEKQMRERLWK